MGLFLEGVRCLVAMKPLCMMIRLLDRSSIANQSNLKEMAKLVEIDLFRPRKHVLARCAQRAQDTNSITGFLKKFPHQALFRRFRWLQSTARQGVSLFDSDGKYRAFSIDRNAIGARAINIERP